MKPDPAPSATLIITTPGVTLEATSAIDPARGLDSPSGCEPMLTPPTEVPSDEGLDSQFSTPAPTPPETSAMTRARTTNMPVEGPRPAEVPEAGSGGAAAQLGCPAGTPGTPCPPGTPWPAPGPAGPIGVAAPP